MSKDKQIKSIIQALKEFSNAECDGKCKTCKLNKQYQDGSDNICNTLLEISAELGVE